MKTLALILFIVMYAGLLIFQKKRAHIAVGAAVVFVILGILPLGEVFSAVDWNVIMMIAGTMGTVYLFIESKMPALLADMIIERMPNVKWVVVTLALFAGVVSAFVDNVATVLMIAPVALDIAKKLGISPAPPIIAISIASNLEGAATLVGDTTSILLGGHANMDFLDFFWFMGKPGLFFIVQISMVAALCVLLIAFRSYRQPIMVGKRTVVKDYFPSWLLLGTVALLIIASFIPAKPAVTNGVICITLMLIGVIRECMKRKNLIPLGNTLKEIDFFTLFLLAGLFVVIAGITEVGVIDDISSLFVALAGDNVFLIYSLLVWASVLFSAFIDNIPYVATMLPVVAGIAASMGVDPYLLYFGLISGATLGGNLTPIGASANITALGILRSNGIEVKAKDFMKLSIPFTLAAVIIGYILVWVFYA